MLAKVRIFFSKSAMYTGLINKLPLKVPSLKGFLPLPYFHFLDYRRQNYCCYVFSFFVSFILFPLSFDDFSLFLLFPFWFLIYGNTWIFFPFLPIFDSHVFVSFPTLSSLEIILISFRLRMLSFAFFKNLWFCKFPIFFRDRGRSF